MDHASEGCVQPVVIALQNGVEFVVVTASATDRQSEKRFAGRTNHFVDGVRANLSGLISVLVADIVIGSGDKKGRSYFDIELARGDHIASDMLANELIHGHVIVERTDHVVAERPQVVDNIVSFESNAFSKPYDIKPVPRPMFAVCW